MRVKVLNIAFFIKFCLYYAFRDFAFVFIFTRSIIISIIIFFNIFIYFLLHLLYFFTRIVFF